jgi:hypothetical protein
MREGFVPYRRRWRFLERFLESSIAGASSSASSSALIVQTEPAVTMVTARRFCNAINCSGRSRPMHGSVRQQRRVAPALGDVEHVGGESQLIGVDVDGEQANGSTDDVVGPGFRGAPVVEFSSLPFLHAETYSSRTSVIFC